MSRKAVISKFRTEQTSEKLKDRKVFKKGTLNFVHLCLFFFILLLAFSCVEILFQLFYIFLNFGFLCFIMAKFDQIWLVISVSLRPLFSCAKKVYFELTRKRIGIGNLKSLLVPLFNSVITFLLEGDTTNQYRNPWEKIGMNRISWRYKKAQKLRLLRTPDNSYRWVGKKLTKL